MSDWISVIILGIIEGITEFLPVSSTGHIQLAENWLTHQSELFDIVIQCGAVLAVLFVFQKRVTGLLMDCTKPVARDYLAKLFLAFVITMVGVLAAEKLGLKAEKPEPKNTSISQSAGTVQPPAPNVSHDAGKAISPKAWTIRVALATLIGGVLFLVVEWWLKNKPTTMDISWGVAAAVGVAQIVAALYSGTSRSGATILFALALGVARPAATEFSFLLGVPTLLAAGGYKFLKAWKAGALGDENWGQVILATIVAAIMAFIAVKWLLKFVQTHTFVAFGWYRIGLAAVIFLLLLI